MNEPFALVDVLEWLGANAPGKTPYERKCHQQAVEAVQNAVDLLADIQFDPTRRYTVNQVARLATAVYWALKEDA